MAIALVQSAKGISATAVSTPAFSGATTAGNLIVLAFTADDYNGTPDAGWTQSAEMEQQTFCGGYIWWRISTGETSLQYTIGSATVSAWVLAEFSGCDAAPYDTSQGQFAQSTGSLYTTDLITPTTGQRLLVAMIGGSKNVNNTGSPYTSWLNSFTEIQSNGTSAGGTNDTVAMAYRLVTGDNSTTFSTGATYPVVSQQSRVGLIISFKESSVVSFNASAFQLDAFQGDGFQAISGATSLVDSVTITAANLTLTGQSITTIDICPITQANLDLTGQSIISVDVTPITQANLSLTGSNILELDTIGITQANLSLTGSDIGLVDVTPITQANLSLTGSNILELDTIGITQANLDLTGQTITTIDAELVTVDSANLSLTGQNIIESETVGITQANLSLAGQAIVSVDVTPITQANLTLTGQDVDVVDVESGIDSITVDAANLTLTGSQITVRDPSLQKDGDADYFAVGGESFSDRLRKATEIASDEAASLEKTVEAVAEAAVEHPEAVGALLSDRELAALDNLATQMRSSAMQRAAEQANAQPRDESARLLAESMQRDEEEALIALGIY